MIPVSIQHGERGTVTLLEVRDQHGALLGIVGPAECLTLNLEADAEIVIRALEPVENIVEATAPEPGALVGDAVNAAIDEMLGS